MTNKDFLLDLKSRAKYLQSRIDECKEKLNENYIYWLPWVGEQLWSETFMVEHYNIMIKEIEELVIEEGKHETYEVFQHWLNRSEKYVSESYNVRERSTGSLFNEVSTWKFICHMNLIKEIKSILRLK